jgi:hypothetical protein
MLRRTLAAALFLSCFAPAVARAEGLIIPFVGVNFGGDSGKDFGDAVDAKRLNWGASFLLMGAGVIGIEGDISYSPDFYGKSDIGGSSTLSFMGNLVMGVPFGGQRGFGIKPYALAGLGLIRSSVESFDEENQFGWDFGGGIMMFFGNHAGIRGEVRYFRTFSDIDFLGLDIGDEPGAVDFTRGSLGFIYRF